MADPSTDEWLAAYAQDDNKFWSTHPGHLMNVVDDLINRLEASEARVTALEAVMRELDVFHYDLQGHCDYCENYMYNEHDATCPSRRAVGLMEGE